MDKLKDILNNIKDRFTNPLFFSFALSWLVINWQITIALFYYNSEQIEKTGFKTIFDFIFNKKNIDDSLLYPLYFALGYTILLPIIRNLIKALYSWAEKWGENWNLKILKEGKIPIKKYIKLREDYDKRTKILEDVINKENVIQSNYNNLKTELLQAQAKESDLQQTIIEKNDYIRQFSDVSILKGYWTVTYKRDPIESIEIYIDSNYYYYVKPFANTVHSFNITNFKKDNNRIFFFKRAYFFITICI